MNNLLSLVQFKDRSQKYKMEKMEQIWFCQVKLFMQVGIKAWIRSRHRQSLTSVIYHTTTLIWSIDSQTHAIAMAWFSHRPRTESHTSTIKAKNQLKFLIQLWRRRTATNLPLLQTQDLQVLSVVSPEVLSSRGSLTTWATMNLGHRLSRSKFWNLPHNKQQANQRTSRARPSQSLAKITRGLLFTPSLSYRSWITRRWRQIQERMLW